MTKTRDELQALLNALEAELPGLLEHHPDSADFWPEFAGMADEVTDNAGPADHDWAQERIDAMLSFHGVDR